MVREKRQVAPSLVDIASSAEHLRKMTVTDDRVKPASSDLACARTSAIETIDAVAEANHAASIRRAYKTISHKDVFHVSVLPFPASLDKADGMQQLTRSVKSAM